MSHMAHRFSTIWLIGQFRLFLAKQIPSFLDSSIQFDSQFIPSIRHFYRRQNELDRQFLVYLKSGFRRSVFVFGSGFFCFEKEQIISTLAQTAKNIQRKSKYRFNKNLRAHIASRKRKNWNESVAWNMLKWRQNIKWIRTDTKVSCKHFYAPH